IERSSCLATGVERHEWFAGLAVEYQLECPEQALAAVLANRWVLCGELAQAWFNDALAEVAHALHDALFFEDVEGGYAGCAGEWVARVGESAWEGAILECLVNLFRDDNAAQRNVTRVDALGEGHEVWRHAKALVGEPLAGAAEANHDLVADHQNAVLVA